MASVYKTLAQVCLVETWQHDQQLTEGRAEAGEQIKLLHGNGYRTVVTPLAFRDDVDATRGENLQGWPPERIREAAERVNRVLEAIPSPECYDAVYGPVFAD